MPFAKGGEFCRFYADIYLVILWEDEGCVIKAYEKAYLGDVVSAFGGIIALNRTVDNELATVIMESYARFGKAQGAAGFFAEVIIAPSFDADAVETIRTLKGWGQPKLPLTGSTNPVAPAHRHRPRSPLPGDMNVDGAKSAR